MELEDLEVSFELLEGLEHDCRILLADSLPGRREQIREMIEADSRFRVEAVSEGMEALSALEEGDYDLVISSPELDDLSGFELTRLIRTSPGHGLIPVILYCEQSKSEDVWERAFDAGAFDVVFAPISGRELITRVENMTRINWLQQRLREMTRKLRKLAYYDDLTGVANRRRLMETFETELERCRRYGRPLGLLYFDIDNFKELNDTRGHVVGDEALIHFGELLRDTYRKVDLIGRMGGEEFLVLLPETDLDGCLTAGRRLVKKLKENPLEYDGEEIPFTVSCGVVSTVPDDEDSVTSLYMEADALLYEAKQQGRNRVISRRESFAVEAE